MKKTLILIRPARLAAIVLGLSISMAALFVAAAEEKNESAGFVEKMKQWQDKMTDKFRDAWEGWRGSKEEQSIGSASVDLREQEDSYTLRLNLPERDLAKVEITLDGDSLHIVAPAENKAGRYEQTITLSGVPFDAKPQIERKPKENLIMVTIPKSGAIVQSERPPPRSPAPGLGSWEEWDRDVFGRMEKLRRDMDRIFDESFDEFRKAPEHKGFFDRPRFDSSLDVQEEGDNYVVRAYLPDHKMENVKVTVEDQTLKIEAKTEETEKNDENGVVRSSKAQYAQAVTLPGPVKADKMKVDKKEGMVVVTLPKA